MLDVILKLKESGLAGRGGAAFPTWKKWEMVKNKKAKTKYIVCNASEGEPGVKKDYYILENYPELVIDGIKRALDFFGSAKAFIYLNSDYYKTISPKLLKFTKNEKIEIVKKSHSAGYIGGEESAALNYIEGKRVEPRLKPPFPTSKGLWACPTLINNVETFYSVSLILSGKYKHKRFYTINGDCLWTGVYELSEDLTIEDIIKSTKNYPDFDFFVQVGGEASGEVLNREQLNKTVSGSASITIYSAYKNEPLQLMKKWIEFFVNESCGQCTPCREGTYRLRELLNHKDVKWEAISALLDTLADTSFCGLGSAVPIPFKTYIENVLAKAPGNNISLK